MHITIRRFFLYFLIRESTEVDNLSAHSEGNAYPQPRTPVPCIGLGYNGITDAPKLGNKFEEGLDVLARWSDGLFYLGTITKVILVLFCALLNV